MLSAQNGAHCNPAVVLAAMIVASMAPPVRASELMPPSQQNALVHKYCAVCHTDASKNGGLSLEHFDAAEAAPSLTAMMLSKLTGGVSLKTARESRSDVNAAALIDKRMRSGAMGAAGIPIPDKATIDALIRAFTVESSGAVDWNIEGRMDAEASAPLLTVSTLREMPSPDSTGEAEAYRLIASCNSLTKEGEVQLAWSPAPLRGNLGVSVDGSASTAYRVEGSERMGNDGGVILPGLPSLALSETKRGGFRTGLPFPAESMTISELFSGESVIFSFANLPKDARQEFDACLQGQSQSGVRRQARAAVDPAEKKPIVAK